MSDERLLTIAAPVAQWEALLSQAGVKIGKRGSTYFSFTFPDGHREVFLDNAVKHLLAEWLG